MPKSQRHFQLYALHDLGDSNNVDDSTNDSVEDAEAEISMTHVNEEEEVGSVGADESSSETSVVSTK